MEMHFKKKSRKKEKEEEEKEEEENKWGTDTISILFDVWHFQVSVASNSLN